MMLKLNGQDRDTILEEVPPYYEELMAKQWSELLDHDEDAPKINNLNEDHMTYLVIYQWCEDTDAKFRAIEARKKALLLSMQQSMQPQAQPWMGMPWPWQSPQVVSNQLGNNVSSMMANNAIQSNNSAWKSVSQQNVM